MDQRSKAKRPANQGIPDTSPGAIPLALLLAAMLQWAALLVVCPSLHELIHHDAGDPQHDCAVTLFLAGQVEPAFVHPLVVRQPAPRGLILRSAFELRGAGSFFLDCRILEHAPPR
jgi:hypothetical protein